jgi:adenosylcobinamide-GDP ribazoletransferase
MTAEIFALLTRLRVSRPPMDLTRAAKLQYLFPLVGLVVGLTAVVAAWLLFRFLGEEQAMVSAGLLLVALYSVTGILHTEGLSDFADGLMAGGTRERKREAMKDVRTGVAGVMAVVMFLIVMFALMTSLLSGGERWLNLIPLPWEVPVFFGLVLAEISGKLAMNLSIYLGPSAHVGMGSLFVQSSSAGKMIVAASIAAVLGILVAGWLAILLVLGLLAGFLVTLLARRDFGGVSGDSFGAANEVGRVVTLLAWVLLI